MHLEPEAVSPAVERLLANLTPGGILYLSWRVTEGADRRMSTDVSMRLLTRNGCYVP